MAATPAWRGGRSVRPARCRPSVLGQRKSHDATLQQGMGADHCFVIITAAAAIGLAEGASDSNVDDVSQLSPNPRISSMRPTSAAETPVTFRADTSHDFLSVQQFSAQVFRRLTHFVRDDERACLSRFSWRPASGSGALRLRLARLESSAVLDCSVKTKKCLPMFHGVQCLVHTMFCIQYCSSRSSFSYRFYWVESRI